MTRDEAVDTLFPEASAKRGRNYLRTVIANLRTTVRAAAGLPDTAAVVERANGRYRLDRELVDVDVWRFEASLAADDPDAAHHYEGDFASGEDYTWAEPHREQLKRSAVRHLASSAAARRAAGDLDGALAAAERAVGIDPYDEAPYGTVMELQRALGREAAVRRTYQQLEQRLAELGLEPGDDLRHRFGH